MSNPVVIETNELEKLIDEKMENLSILNCSMTNPNHDAKAEHVKERIPTAIYFDLF